MDPMTIEEIQSLPQYFGVYFDPETGLTYTEDGEPTNFTFEAARWTGPFDLHLAWPRLNPLSFATRETAEKVLKFVQATIPPLSLTTAEIDESQRVTGPFTRTVERHIRVTSGGKAESFSAGMIANSIIRNGEEGARRSFRAELQLAGLL